MGSLPGFLLNITGASGSQGLLGPKQSWRTYVLPRGAYAAQSSTGTLITFDSSATAARFTVNDWIQAGLQTDNIRQVGAVGGNSISLSGANLTVSTNDRIFLFGQTQPTVVGGSATYTPNTRIFQRDDDAGTTYSNSMISTDSNGLAQGFAVPAFYDVLIQDGNQANQGSIVDLAVGVPGGISTTEASIFGATVTVNAAIGVTGWATFGQTVTMSSALGVTGTLVVGGTATASNMIRFRYAGCGTDGFASPGSGASTSVINLSERKTSTTGALSGLQGQVINAAQSGTPIISFIEAQAGTARIDDALGSTSSVGTIQTINSVAIHQSNATVNLARPFSATIQVGSEAIGSSNTSGVITTGVAMDALPPTRWAGSSGTMLTYYGLRVQAPGGSDTWITAANSLAAQLQGVVQISGAAFFPNSPRLESNSGNALRIRGQMGDGGGTATVKVESGVTLSTSGDKICQFENPTDVVKAWVDKDGRVAASGIGPVLMAGSGSPQGVATAPVGSIYMRSDGGANTSLYVKESGTTSTGWVAK